MKAAFRIGLFLTIGLSFIVVFTISSVTASEDQSALRREALQVVKDGSSHAVVIIGEAADEATREAAELLVSYVEKATNAVLPIITGNERHHAGKEDNKQISIYIGSDSGLPARHPSILRELSGMDGDGFVIRAAGKNIAIAGATSLGTQYGVISFLERYVGVRWLMPGPDGEDVPKSGDLLVPKGQLSEEPAFSFRLFSPLHIPAGVTGEVQYEWAKVNRMHGAVKFHHNLYNLFPPSEYAESHPEFYPLRDGTRFIPTTNTAWQPCFSADGLAEEAIRKINAYFTEHPEEQFFSLGVNDGGGFCEAGRIIPTIPIS
ncbi:DUF4838 domain-containing protein [Paenibacillus sp. J5C_2022]|uniref:DUF4838 domain-containing protein n=1 Tax=Paenibacillus sp. J5C2022 TaxID=2977129 RepID=UPI0021CF8857|nr:DUF4838 domain-containing protein [Paenibacillus sp. J5C2022]MCU6710952.1 DUF4838 domain-containing protein [Paenibacillus sp. J5C2022]